MQRREFHQKSHLRSKFTGKSIVETKLRTPNVVERFFPRRRFYFVTSMFKCTNLKHDSLVHNEERSLYFHAILVFVFLIETTMVN